ncbi:MAG TPA: hypothetical protein VFF74_08020 [Methylophilaceae bacterium]|nr:hypothetical protein [Methylophilaceae bacterium]
MKLMNIELKTPTGRELINFVFISAILIAAVKLLFINNVVSMDNAMSLACGFTGGVLASIHGVSIKRHGFPAVILISIAGVILLFLARLFMGS